VAVRGQDSTVFGEGPAVREIKRFAIEISDTTAGLFDDDRARGLVPDFLALIGL
jgi:hypothetical protein